MTKHNNDSIFKFVGIYRSPMTVLGLWKKRLKLEMS